MHKYLTMLLIMASANIIASPFQVTDKKFTFHSSFLTAPQFDVQAWNPTRLTDGSFLLYYHGHNTHSCHINENCTDDSCFKQSPPWSPKTYTGLDNAIAWTPRCPGTPLFGMSMGAISKSSGNNGVGLYTHTGPNFAYLGNAFIQPKHKTPSHQIMGTYASFLVHREGLMRPFSSNCTGIDCDNRVRLRVWAKQAITHTNIASGTQSQQKLAIVLRNSNRPASQIELTPYTLCAGVNCDYVQAQSARFDPNQGGIPFIGGPLLNGGQATYLQDGTPTWQSYGPRTKSNRFGVTWFHYEISWKNFVAIMRHVTRQAGLDGDDDIAVQSIFGPNWQDRLAWQLADVRLGQEVFNPFWNQGTISAIGGFTSWVQVNAVLR